MFCRNLTCFRVFQPVESLNCYGEDHCEVDWGKIKGSYISGEEVGNQKRSHCSRKQSVLGVGGLKKTYNAKIVGDGSVAEVQQHATSHNSNDPCDVFLNPSALKFAFWFPPFSTRICMEDPSPSARKICTCLCGRSTSDGTTICRCLRGTTMEFLGKS